MAPTHSINPVSDKAHTHTVILLKGFGRTTSVRDFATQFLACKTSTGERLSISAQFPNVRWVFPGFNYETRHVWQELVAWYDQFTHNDQVGPVSMTQFPALEGVVEELLDVVEEEEQKLKDAANEQRKKAIKGAGASNDDDAEDTTSYRGRIVLGGMAQGFLVSLATLGADEHGGFAGLCGLSSRLPLSNLRHMGDEINSLTVPFVGYAPVPAPNPAVKTIVLREDHETNLYSTLAPVPPASTRHMRDLLPKFAADPLGLEEFQARNGPGAPPKGADHVVAFLRSVMEAST